MKWEVQHDAVSCEDFAQWKQDNDPDVQKQGLAAHLNANGIGNDHVMRTCIGMPCTCVDLVILWTVPESSLIVQS